MTGALVATTLSVTRTNPETSLFDVRCFSAYIFDFNVITQRW